MPSRPKAPNAKVNDAKYLAYFGRVSLEITLLTATVGAGICQFDNTKRPTAARPVSIKNIIEIRVMSFPYPPSHFLAAISGLNFWPEFLA
jgi:hypothetical protein